MLRSSDDFPADDFWARGGGNAIIKRVTDRYKLRKTTAPYNGDWWNTMSTTADLVRYYDMLLDGTGGLPPEQADIILSNLAASTPRGVDGYPQRFGIPDGLFAEPVAVKQGWMCCWGPNDQVHLSTGVVGPDRRYVDRRGVDAARRRSHRARHPHPGAQDDVPGRADLSAGTLATLITGASAGIGARRSLPLSRSGRRSRVRAAPAHAARLRSRAWSPDSSTSGTAKPRHTGGRV